MREQPRPWHALYDEGMPHSLEVEHESVLHAWVEHVRVDPKAPALHFMGAAFDRRRVDDLSSAFATWLGRAGVGLGDRVALGLQNVPQFVVAVLGAWKRGAIVVPLNPMLRVREAHVILDDAEPTVLVAEDDLHDDVLAQAARGTTVSTTVTTSALAFAAVAEGPLAGDEPPSGDAFRSALAEHPGGGADLAPLAAGDLAFLGYTSGTTGPPKGAMNTHGNVAFNAQAYRDWVGLGSDDVCLALAPLFHVTGTVAHVALSLLSGMPLVLGYRFDPAYYAELVERHGVTFTIGAITAYIALLNDEDAMRRDLSSLRAAYSGGAPIPPATVRAFQEAVGPYIRNVYGLTETTSPSHLVPADREAPVDEASGALSVGVPIFDTEVRLVDDDGRDVAPGAPGELWIRGPQVVPGYWRKPDETAAAIRDGWLATGDVGTMRPDGWFFVIDRKKDQINAAGFKIWPREVEDALFEHPAVQEVTVIGVPDPYRGETVKAVVVPRIPVTAAELVAFTRERLAAYKVPRIVEFRSELPKTASGKVLRRVLKADHADADA